MDMVLMAYLKKYVDDSLVGAGALKGAPCTIKSITEITGGNRVTFSWVDDEETEHTSTLDVMDGVDGQDGTNGTDGVDGTDGVGIASCEVVDGHLIVTYTDGDTEDAGAVGGGGGSSSLDGLTDVDLSTPSNGQVLKYNSTSEKWENANESGGGGSSDDLTLKLIEASGMDVTNFANVTGLEYTTGKYISKTNGKTQQDYAYSKITTFNVQEGEIYHVYTRSIGQTVMYALYDANGDAIEWYPTNTMADGQRYEHRLVIIPSNAKTMAVGLAYTYNYASTQNPIIQKTTIDDVEFGVDHGGNVLYGKKWCSCGDSFTAGEGNMDTDKIAMQPKTYPYLITQRNHMVWQQLAIGGATFTNIEGAQYCFTDTTASKNYTQIAADCDYVTFSYGLNEGSLTAEQIGAKGDATTGTLWGAWDTVVKSVLTANPTVKLGIIIEDSWLTQTYHDALIDIAKYYMIPYLDLRNGEQVSCNIGGRLSDCSADVKTLRDNAFKMGVNDAHPNSNAHKYRSTMIENFLRSL